jgi:hypothetical protein
MRTVNMPSKLVIHLQQITALLVAALLTACASGPTIITNSAPDFNLADQAWEALGWR